MNFIVSISYAKYYVPEKYLTDFVMHICSKNAAFWGILRKAFSLIIPKPPYNTTIYFCLQAYITISHLSMMFDAVWLSIKWEKLHLLKNGAVRSLLTHPCTCSIMTLFVCIIIAQHSITSIGGITIVYKSVFKGMFKTLFKCLNHTLNKAQLWYPQFVVSLIFCLNSQFGKRIGRSCLTSCLNRGLNVQTRTFLV